MKKLLFTILIFFVLVISASFSSAQNNFCCCVSGDGVLFSRAECSGVGGFLNDSIIGDLAACKNFCAPPCEFLSCQGNNTGRCSCGNNIIDSGFCCGLTNEAFNTGQECNSACASESEHNLTGVVKDLNGQLVVNAIVTADDKTAVTNNQGAYSLVGVVENVQLSVSVSAPGCVGKTETLIFTGETVKNFFINCSSSEDNACPSTGRCCAPGTYCSGSENVGVRNCANGYSCFLNCNDCIPYTIEMSDCSYNSCLLAENKWCNESEEWVLYDLTNHAEKNEYCSKCPGDIECTTTDCITSGACDGVCPVNCGPDDDPDCGNPCYYSPTQLRWCDSRNEFGSGKTWIDFDSSDDSDLSKFCRLCSHVSTAYCQPVCGNGIREGDEECDLGTEKNGLLGSSCSSDCKLTITTGCVVDGVVNSQYEECDPDDPNLQDKIDANPQYSSCSDDCKWIYHCNQDDKIPASFSLSHVPKKKEVLVIINLETACQDQIDTVAIYRCKGVDCLSTENFGKINKFDNIQSSYSFSDKNVEPLTTYYYYILETYKDDDEIKTSPETIVTGEVYCMADHPSTFCRPDDLNNIYRCNDSNKFVVSNSCGSQECVVKNNGVVSCTGVGACSDCNSFYEMFGEKTSSINSFKVDYKTDATTQQKCSFLKNEFVCYEDKTITVSNKVDYCNEVASCYNYSSKDACVDNPCNKFLVNDEYMCEWTNLTYEGVNLGEAFGLGTCNFKDSELDDCSLCHSNNLLFPVCNKDLCSAFGDCYYIEDDEECKNKKDLSCKDYDNEQDCVGDTGNFEIDDFNNVMNFSDDLFGFEKCKWDSDNDKCFRDADDNRESITNQSFIFYGEEGAGDNINMVDCYNLEGDEKTKCLTDFQSPTTNINLPENKIFGITTVLPFGVNDNKYGYEDINTYYCLKERDETDKCQDIKSFPKKESENAALTLTFSESQNELDNYTIYYYSADKARNMEPVKSYNFSVDAKKPTIIYKYNYESQELNGEWMSDLTARFNFSEQVTCNITLKNSQGQEEGDEHINNKIEKNFVVKYNNLPDENYYFDVECVDKYGNEIDEIKDAKVEADESINSPLPANVTKNLNVKLSVNTSNKGVCRYSSETISYSGMSEEIHDDVNKIFQGSFTTNNELYHYKDVAFTHSGVYELFVACNISYDRPEGIIWKVTEGNLADRIIFSIDRISPVTIIANDDTEEQFDFNRYYQSAELNFYCVDPTVYYDENGNQIGLNTGGFNGVFGCKEFKVSINDEDFKTYEEPQKITLPTETETEPVEKNYTLLFYSVDKGNNEEERRTEILKIDNIIPNINLKVEKEGEERQTFGRGTYKLIIISDKKIERVDELTYSTDTGASNKEIYYSFVDNHTIEAQLTISDQEEFFMKKGALTFNIKITDYHEVPKEQEFEFEFNTENPPAPKTQPIFDESKLTAKASGTGKSYKDENNQWYPFIYYDTITLADGKNYEKIYIIGTEDLFITGYTEERGTVNFYRKKSTSALSFQKVESQEQTTITELKDTKKLNEKAEKGSTSIILQTNTPLTQWSTGKYISLSKFSDKTNLRTNYNDYGKAYKIINSAFDTTIGQTITLETPLEKEFQTNSDIYLYADEKYDKWFGKTVSLPYSESGDNLYYIKLSLEDSLNEGFGEQYQVLVDPNSPKTTRVYPSGGTITDTSKPLIVEFKEKIGESGLKEDSVFLVIIKDGQTTTINRNQLTINNTEENSYKKYVLSYKPAAGWTNGNYTVKVNVEDYAGNQLSPLDNYFDGELSFIIDTNTPNNPLFNVTGASNTNMDPEKRMVISNQNPEIILDFTKKGDGTTETLNINLTSIEIIQAPGSTNINIEKEQDKNVFKITLGSNLAEGIYEFEAKANKILPNQSAGPEGVYQLDREEKPFKIIIDKTPPEFRLTSESIYVSANKPFTIFANITNEDAYLKSKVIVEDEELDNIEMTKDEEKEEYHFTIPASFDWGEDGLKNIRVTIKDYAENENSQIIQATLDSEPPSISVTGIIAPITTLFFPEERNATVGQINTVTLIGVTDLDTKTLCYKTENQEGGEICEVNNECLGSTKKDCFETIPGGQQKRFYIEIRLYGTEPLEHLNNIILEATDHAGLKEETPLRILLDLKPPAHPSITFQAVKE